MIAILTIVTTLACLFVSNALNQDAFASKKWQFDEDVNVDQTVRFTVALNLRNVDQMKKHFSDVSTPGSPLYGKYLTPVDMDELYGPTAAAKERVSAYFGAIPSSEVKLHPHGDLMHVVAPIRHIERHLSTKLGFVSHKTQRITQRSVRAREPLKIPADIASLVSFVSLNAPVNHVKPRGAKSLRQAKQSQAAETIAVTGGNEEALVRFNPTCANGAANYYSPPCANEDPKPSFTFAVTTHANDRSDPYQLGTDPTIFEVPYYNVYCYDNSTNACSGTPAHGTCNCLAKISPLPKYTQLRVNITETLNGVTTNLGASSLFALTDTATARFLSELYSIPAGQQVNHGSNQSVAEFYEEFYSNKDLENFFALSGLPNASIPTANNYYIVTPNDQSNPGGEAQLDVEYIMALAPNAPTFFYSIGTYNPSNPNEPTLNEGFLDYLTLVESQEYPPLVHSLSYGDEEGDIFNSSNNATIAYGDRCNEEFMQLGLRGLTILFSSGDDGIGSSLIRDDPVSACQKAMPEWPASSPYVTAVGATMLTDKYLPICGQNYAVSSLYPGLPETEQLTFDCTGTAETVCTSTFGGVITSGGGFSDVLNRSDVATWQDRAVNNYLRSANYAAYPPLTYFNSFGRGYPDVATYGSNYFVYLNGKIQRESGTSASAPVMAAMVTLWNDIRLAYGQPPLGFIAPFLYSIAETNPQAFNDIVTGNNACGVGSSLETAPCCTYSFAASPGWDAVTGLGSPNFQIISNLVINNQTAFPNLAAYPAGGESAGTLSTGSDDGSDDNVKTYSVTGLVLGAIAIGVSFMLCCYIVYTRTTSKEGKEPLLFP